MDQSAFRSLLSSSTSTSTPSSSTSSSRPKFGAPPPKPSTSSSSGGKLTDFKPRPPSKKKEFKKKPATEEGGYRDRAAERRAGKAGDFREAEKLLEEFEERGKQGDEEDRIKREEQRKYLGGDATHSILVKGLDMALLNQEKAKLSMKAEGELQDVEQQLDEQFEKPVSSKKGKGKGKEKEIGKGKGKTRDELLMELKASREGGDQEKNEAGLGKGWKKLGAPETAVTKGKGFAPVGGGEKKLRKKKKKVVDPSTPATPLAATSAVAPPPSINSVPPASGSTEMEKEDLPTTNPDEEDDDDIFGDVGDYKGLESDSDSSSDEKKPRIKKETSLPPPPLPPPSNSNSTKRKYFDDEEAEDESISTAPSAVADLASRQALHSATQPQPKRRVKREDSFGSQSGSESDSDAGATTGKLQPLSGSGPNVSELLKFDKLAQEEEERKAKKQKRKQEKEEKELSRADKDNRHYLQMEAYLEKKKNGGVTPERKQSDERDMRDKEGMYADI